MRVLPASRATLAYDPTRRPWYRKSAIHPSEITLSSVYLDAFGAGKVVTMATPAFQKKPPTCQPSTRGAIKGPGCTCATSNVCWGRCYGGTCSAERIEGVLGSDIMYSLLDTQVGLSTAGHPKSCGAIYNGKTTLCYMFDRFAHLIYGPDLKAASNGDTKAYQAVGLGTKEPEVMRHLVYTHKFFTRIETISHEGQCRTTPYTPAQTMEGMELTSKEKDEAKKLDGHFTPIALVETRPKADPDPNVNPDLTSLPQVISDASLNTHPAPRTSSHIKSTRQAPPYSTTAGCSPEMHKALATRPAPGLDTPWSLCREPTPISWSWRTSQ